MIVWIASYPRSGNTLTRTILKRCFDAKTYSIYDEKRNENLVHTMGLEAFCAMARASPETYFVKTHELPSDNNDPEIFGEDRTLYIARDGRAAMSSHKAYLEDISHQIFALEAIVLGAPPIIGWSDHVMGWLDRPAEKQLVLRYEQLSAPPREVLEGIAAFIDRPVLRDFDVNFADLHEKNPVYFRVGRNEPGIKEIERKCPAIFWTVNGQAMDRLGYGSPRPETAPLPPATLAELRRAVMHARNLALRGRPTGDGAEPQPEAAGAGG
ncbi:MAG: sulfotransferase domain-containing protein [Caulobacteraceae bacterium]